MNKLNKILFLTMFATFGAASFAAESDEYVYQQGFMPKETVEIDLATTAMFVTDPQNDFLS